MALSMWCVFLLTLARTCYSQTNVSVTTSRGRVVGLRWDPHPVTQASYDAFLGIPYGQIPARFQAPVPRKSWSVPLVTQAEGPPCPQPGTAFSEDCLYINVFTPVNATLSPGKYPTLTFIHGGAFTFGSGSPSTYGPDFIVPQGVVFVTMNYRLGAAGFLSLGSPLAPGNMGLLDTQLALRWVQDEISVFGGDPRQVTIAGQSAGSVMTMFHYLSPVSAGMFKRAIAHSGSALSTWGHVTADEAVRRAKVLADAVGCNTTHTDTVLACLQQTDINNIVNNQNITMPIENIAAGTNLPFVPVIDTSFGNPPFFTDTLDNLMQGALTRARPLITGFTTEEGILKFMDESWKNAESHSEAFIPLRMSTNLNDRQKSAIGKKVKSSYFPDTVDQNKVLDIVNVFTDYAFAYPAIQVIQQFSNWTYGYVFAYNGNWAPLPSYFTRFHVTGVFHGADLYYLFYNGQDLSSCGYNQANIRVKDNLVRWWTNFIKGGVPDPSGGWGTASNGHYLRIDSPISTINSSDIEARYYNFWATMNDSSTDNSAHISRHNQLLISVIILSVLLKTNF